MTRVLSQYRLPLVTLAICMIGLSWLLGQLAPPKAGPIVHLSPHDSTPEDASTLTLLNPQDIEATPASTTTLVPASLQNNNTLETTAAQPIASNTSVASAAEAPSPLQQTIANTRSGPDLRDEQWIKNQPDEYFTIQLIASFKREDVDRFARSLDSSLPVAIFQTERSNKPWYGLIVGSFATSGAAKRAENTLPEGSTRFKPWVRAFGKLPL